MLAFAGFEVDGAVLAPFLAAGPDPLLLGIGSGAAMPGIRVAGREFPVPVNLILLPGLV